MQDITQAYTILRRYSVELCAFVLVARHGQLSSAAAALNLSQPGLSQKIKNLELSLGVTLFKRVHRGVELTPDGADLYARVELPMNQLATGFADFQHRKANPSVLVSVDYAFAAFWLLPRIPRLRALFHPLDISVLTSQDPTEANSRDADLIVRMDGPDAVERGAVRLIDETVSAVCSPSFLERHPNLAHPADLLAVPLLTLKTPAKASWFSWQEWFAAFGVSGKGTAEMTSLDTYDLVIQAARDGIGVALGWHGLIDDLITQGKLVKAMPHVASSRRGYFLSVLSEKGEAFSRAMQALMPPSPASLRWEVRDADTVV
ncbi:LysR substrate-binding domain-containing protein [Roseibium sp. M-1]